MLVHLTAACCECDLEHEATEEDVAELLNDGIWNCRATPDCEGVVVLRPSAMVEEPIPMTDGLLISLVREAGAVAGAVQTMLRALRVEHDATGSDLTARLSDLGLGGPEDSPDVIHDAADAVDDAAAKLERVAAALIRAAQERGDQPVQ